MINPTDVEAPWADGPVMSGHSFVTGQAGAGKTILAMTFLNNLLTRHESGEHHD